MTRKLIILISMWLIFIPATAQYDISEFQWEVADIAFSYPGVWEEPFAVQRFGVETVIIAESDVLNDERAPEIPFILMTLTPNDGTDLDTMLENSLRELDIQINREVSISVLDTTTNLASGTNRDASFFGMGSILRLDSNILTIVGRVPAEQQDEFDTLFNVLMRSLARGQEFGAYVPFGMVWSNAADEDDPAFYNLEGIALDPNTQSIYSGDGDVGLLRFDMLSGRLLEIIPNPDIVTPVDLTVGIDGTVYIADPDCPCIHVYFDGTWQDSIGGFGIGSPLSIQSDDAGNLYTTNNDGENFNVIRFNVDGETNIPTVDPFFIEPMLFTANGQLYAYDFPVVQQFDGSQFIIANEFEFDTFHDYIQIAPDGTYLLATENLIDLYTPDGLLIDSIDITESSLGDRIQGLALGQDNTIYAVVGGLGVTEIIALSQRVPDSSLGLPILEPYRVSGSFLGEANTGDTWYFDGTTNQVVDIAVQGFSSDRDFDFSVTLLAPDGSEVATISEDSNPALIFSRNLNNIQLDTNGLYQIRLDYLNGEGIYDLTLITPTPFAHNDIFTERYGMIPASYPSEQWIVSASGQTTLTFTAEPLDPTRFTLQMALYDVRGQLIQQNDPSQENTAQIAEFRVPINGDYIIEVSRIEGIGRYRLTLETVEPES